MTGWSIRAPALLDATAPQSFSNVVPGLSTSAPPLFPPLLAAPILHRGSQAFEHFLERLPAEKLEQLNSDPAATALTLDLFEHSPYFAEELILHAGFGRPDRPSAREW